MEAADHLEPCAVAVADDDLLHFPREHVDRRVEFRPTCVKDRALVAGVTAIPGDLQTDFVAGPNKGDGLRELAARLGTSVALAVGDSATDVPMFEVAEHAYAPAHVRAELGARARVTRRPYQAGLLEAVARFLGHDPRRCETCAPPPLPADARVVLAALRAKDGGALTKLAQLLRLARL